MKYLTTKGDTWDSIAYKVYGEETFIAPLISANQEYIETVVFDDENEIEIPDISKTDSSIYLPPWRR